jgi:hypothetical protein
MPGPRKGKSFLVAGTIVTGVLLGIGLYAGGGDFLSTFFSNKHEGIATGNPAAITERPRPTASVAQSPAPGPVTNPVTEQPVPTAPATATTSEQSPAIAAAAPQPVATPSATAAQAPHTAIIVTAPSRNPAIVTVAGSSHPQAPVAPVRSKPANVDPRTTKSPGIAASTPALAPKKSDPEKPAARRPQSTPMVRDIPLTDKPAMKRDKGPTSNLTVQVRATTDESEANLVAKRLKHRGMSDVVIVQSDRNGKPYYRVRYGSYKSNDDARAAAAKSGFDGTWVLKK